jgi:hypothetical protein
LTSLSKVRNLSNNLFREIHFAQGDDMQRKAPVSPAFLTIALCVSATLTLAQSPNTRPHRFQLKPAPVIVHGTMSTQERRNAITSAIPSGSNQLPVWNYEVVSSRDGFLHQGVIVGRNPNEQGTNAAVSVPTQIVPIVLKFQRIAPSLNLDTGIFTTVSGHRTSNPTLPDTGCFAGANNVPLKLLRQSPIFQNADFNFGGTPMGPSQYEDAVQRGSFWSLIDKDAYHIRLSQQVLPPLIVNVPAASGISVNKDVFEPFFSMCGPEGIVDIGFLDAVAVNALTSLPGINPGTFPMFMIYNTGMSFGDPRDLNNCCAGGYHSIDPVGPVTFQTYSPFDFDVSGFFVSSANDTAVVSHEAGEWINDPYLINDTPAWGHIGQVAGCAHNLEIGDPLTGIEAPRIVGKNGFTYHLQELAFFSWFFGDPSIAVHGWDSNNGTFLTDAGPPCK